MFKKIILLLILFLTSYNVYSQNFRLKFGPSYAHFFDINNNKVNFYGASLNYTYFFFKRLGLELDYAKYLPSTYYGEVKVWDFNYYYIPAYVTGGAQSFGFGLNSKIFESKSKKLTIYSNTSLNYFTHSAEYEKEIFVKHYGGDWIDDIKIYLLIFNPGIGASCKIKHIPFFVEFHYNYILSDFEPESYLDEYSVPFSSFIRLNFGVSFPIMYGPSPNEIQKIEY